MSQRSLNSWGEQAPRAVSRSALLPCLGALLTLALLWQASDAAAQMCGDGGTCDAGSDASVSDAGASDAGPSDAGPSDAGPSDGGMSMLDGSVGDAGALDASTPDASVPDGPMSVAACSCETALNVDGLIHLCTGSFDREACSEFDCTQGLTRSERCSPSGVRMCCTMKARRLYSHLYEDCTHPNCESGFTAQCQEFGGVVTLGPCDAPMEPDDPDTETGDEDDGCSVQPGRGGGGNMLSVLALLGLTVCLVRSRSRH